MMSSFVNGWLRFMCWIVILLFPVTYLLTVLCFSFMKVLDWNGITWANLFGLANDSLGDIWSFARYGR